MFPKNFKTTSSVEFFLDTFRITQSGPIYYDVQ